MQKLQSNIVIIGASHAGLSCAEKLRSNGFEGGITVLDRDSGLPLQRPPLSKAYLHAPLSDPHSDSRPQDEAEAEFLLRRPDFFSQFDIELKTGCLAKAIHVAEKSLTITDESGTTRLSYDQLVLATGAEPRRLPIEGADAPNLMVLRTAADARALRSSLHSARRVLVIGGGYIGLEAAASMRKQGCEVHVIEAAPRLLARVASPEISAFYKELHETHGVAMHIGAGLKGFSLDETGRITGAALSNGQHLACDLVLLGIGVVPDQALASEAGLTVSNGIEVDTDYQTSAPSIYAIGDVAFNPARAAMRVESIHHAQFSGAYVAAQITGSQAPATEAWWFWSDQYDVKLQIAGLMPSAAPEQMRFVRRAGRRAGSLSVWSWLDGQFVAVESANDPQAYMIGKKMLEAGQNLNPDEIADPDFQLKSLLV